MSQLDAALDAKIRTYIGRRVGPFNAWNAVSRPLVWQWCSAMGDNNPLYLDDAGVTAPPTSLQMWTMRDVNGDYGPGSTDVHPFEVLDVLEAEGYSGVVAADYDQTYHRYVTEGEQLLHFTTIVEISELKSTGLGDGYFVTELAEFFVGDDCVGEARVTYFKYRPPEDPTGPGAKQDTGGDANSMAVLRTHPVENHDSKHYWQGLRDGKLLIQKCSSCETLRHPPLPMCSECQSLEWGTVESKGVGTLHSYTVMHYPHIPPFDYPNMICLVDLDDGVRIVSQMVEVKPDQLEIGMRVEAVLTEVQDGLVLPLFKPASSNPTSASEA